MLKVVSLFLMFSIEEFQRFLSVRNARIDFLQFTKNFFNLAFKSIGKIIY